MNRRDLERIEQELGIELPASYRATMLEFPIAAYEGNDVTELWDDAELLIQENLQFRAGMSGGVKPWPRYLFCLGGGGSGCVYALDLRAPEAPVWWIDHGHVDLESSGEVELNFALWAEDYLRDLREDLESDGIDPDGTPQERQRVESENARGDFFGLAAMVILGLVAVIATAILVETLR